MKDLFSKCDQIPRKLWIWSHLLKKSLRVSFNFCAVFILFNNYESYMKQQQLLLFILREKCPVVSLTRGEIDVDRLRSERNSFF